MISFSLISSYSIGVPFLVGVLTILRQSVMARKVFLLVLLGVVTEIIALSMLPNNNHPVINVYIILELFIIANIFSSFYCGTQAKKMIKVFTVLFTLFALTNFFFFQGPYSLNSHTLLFKSIVVTAMCTNAFQRMLYEGSDLARDPFFYFASAMLFYYVGNMFTFGFSDQYFQDPEHFPIDIWKIHAVFNIIFNLLLSVNLWKARLVKAN